MQQEGTIPGKDLRQVLTGSEEKVPYTIKIEISFTPKQIK